MKGGSPPRWAPAWVEDLAVPVWVSTPDRLLSRLNPGAEALLGLDEAACLGRPCHATIAATAVAGDVFCQMDCPVRCGIETGSGLSFHHITTHHGDGPARVFYILPIAVRGPDDREPWIVHCGLEVACERLWQYVRGLAAGARGHGPPLTIRELEVLELLVSGADQQTIADTLHISYHTVRNHIQNILPKLAAHSISQAVAVHLLDETLDPG